MKHRITAISLFLLISSISVSAQSPSPIPAPSQFATAHTAFLASGSAPAAGARQALVAEMVYSSLYRSLSASGQYHLLAAPADAELSMIISTEMFVSDATNGSSIPYPYLRLEIYDTKTHALLWALDEPLQGAFREKTFEKNVDEAVASLAADLKTLAAGSIPGDPSTATVPTKTRFSDEGKK
jgi:hypothetical protein